jgi:excreted virulence factor EspC (type VII ESX diderm)
MNSGAVQFPADSVRRHAATVDAIAADVEQARGAAGEVTMDTQAYGILCQFLPGLLMPVFAVAVTTLDGSADGLHETAADLRATADQMDSTDQVGARRITAAGPPAQPTIALPL